MDKHGFHSTHGNVGQSGRRGPRGDLPFGPTDSGGDVHRYGSIAVIERFIKSLKVEWLPRLVISLHLEAMRADLSAYTSWYNEHRPHQSLEGCTPREVYERRTPANRAIRYEPRAKWPAQGNVALSCVRLTLSVTYHEGRQHLPIIELKQAA